MSPHYPHSNSDRIPYFKIVKHHLQVNTNWVPISFLGSNLHLRIARQELFMVSIGKVQNLLGDSCVFREAVPVAQASGAICPSWNPVEHGTWGCLKIEDTN